MDTHCWDAMGTQQTDFLYVKRFSILLAYLRLELGTVTFVMCKESMSLSKMTNTLRKRKETTSEKIVKQMHNIFIHSLEEKKSLPLIK